MEDETAVKKFRSDMNSSRHGTAASNSDRTIKEREA